MVLYSFRRKLERRWEVTTKAQRRHKEHEVFTTEAKEGTQWVWRFFDSANTTCFRFIILSNRYRKKV